MRIRHSITVLLVLSLVIPLLAAAPAGKTFRLLKKGTDGIPAGGEASGRRRAPWIEVAADQASYLALWKREAPGTPGEVDFRSESAIFLLLGIQSTGGYAIEPISVEPPANGTLRVHARLVQPMDDAVVTETLTAPFAVIAVRARGIAKVEWIDADGRLLATRIVE
jgi:hypothetical protein